MLRIHFYEDLIKNHSYVCFINILKKHYENSSKNLVSKQSIILTVKKPSLSNSCDQMNLLKS